MKVSITPLVYFLVMQWWIQKGYFLSRNLIFVPQFIVSARNSLDIKCICNTKNSLNIRTYINIFSLHLYRHCFSSWNFCLIYTKWIHDTVTVQGHIWLDHKKNASDIRAFVVLQAFLFKSRTVRISSSSSLLKSRLSFLYLKLTCFVFPKMPSHFVLEI